MDFTLISNQLSDFRGLFVFICLLRPCSINKIQRPSKAQSKNRKIDEETSVSRRFYLFCQVLRPCSIEHVLIKKLLHWVAFLYGFYPNLKLALWFLEGFFIEVLSVTILETTKTVFSIWNNWIVFYRSQFWRLQKPQMVSANDTIRVRSCL